MVSSLPSGGIHRHRRPILAGTAAAVPAAGLLSAPSASARDRAPDRVQQLNLVADLPGAAVITDPNLVNAWGCPPGRRPRCGSRTTVPTWIDGLWGLMPGNGVAGRTSDIRFSAGPAGEQHGLLGLLSAT
jgi:hypothetical protein